MVLTGEQQAVSNQLEAAIHDLKYCLISWERGDVGMFLRFLGGTARSIEGVLLTCQHHMNKAAAKLPQPSTDADNENVMVMTKMARVY